MAQAEVLAVGSVAEDQVGRVEAQEVRALVEQVVQAADLGVVGVLAEVARAEPEELVSVAGQLAGAAVLAARV